MKPFKVNQVKLFQSTLLFAVLLCFYGCNSDNDSSFEQATEITEKCKDLEIKFNELASKFERDGKTYKKQQAENLRNDVGDFNDEIKYYIDKKDISKTKLKDWEDEFEKFSTSYSGLFEQPSPEPIQKPTSKPKPKPIQKPKPKPIRVEDSDPDADGVVAPYDKCPYVYGLPEYNGCPPPKPPPPPPPDRDLDGYIDSVDDCPDDPGIAPDGCPIKCNSFTRFAPFKLEVECKNEIKTGTLNIKPNINLVLEDFRLLGNDNGQINYYIKNASGRKLNNRSQSNINAGPNLSQIKTDDLLLNAGRSYKLTVETISDNLNLIADSCADNNFSNNNVELTFTGEPFVHQLNFCKK